MKRKNQTFCLLCEGTVGDIKKQVKDALEQHGTEVDDLRLLKDETVLDDNSSLDEIADNSILYCVLKVSDNEYEQVQIDSTDMQ